MKRIGLLIVLLATIQMFSQNKAAKASLEVNGVCMMCKSRIEKACLKSKGVKFANWDIDTHELKVIYDERKTDLQTISQIIANAGHDNKIVIASDEAYAKVHACCKYRDEAIKDNHKDIEEEGKK